MTAKRSASLLAAGLASLVCDAATPVDAQEAIESHAPRCNLQQARDAIVYPPKALECGLEGTVRARFKLLDGVTASRIFIGMSTNRALSPATLAGASNIRCDLPPSDRIYEWTVEYKLPGREARPADAVNACMDGKPLRTDPAGP